MAARDDVPAGPLSYETTPFDFGDGVAERLPAVLEDRRVEAPLVVTDPGIEAAGVLAAVLDPVDLDVDRYDASREPSTDEFGDLPAGPYDAVVAIGGGSCLDTAKLLALLLEHGGMPADYLGVGRVPGPVLPVVAVPTTSGTGSQTTQTAVITHEGVKRGVSDERLRPDVALVDPTLTFGLPAAQTALSGFDAFVHALESLTARDHSEVAPREIRYQGTSPLTRPWSRQALGLVHRHLERVVADGDDREARRAMSLGSHLAAAAFSNAGLGAVHALASAVGGMTGRPHGACLAASIRAGLSYNLPARREQYARIAADLGLAGPDDPADDGAAALLDECDRLVDALGLPGSFDEVGLDAGSVDELVAKTRLQERRLVTNPRPVTSDLGDAVRATLD